MKLSVSQKNWLLLLAVALAVASVALAIPHLVAKHQPSLRHLWNLGIVGSAAKYFLSFLGVWMTYFLVMNLAAVSKVQDDWLSELWRYLLCIGVCGFIAIGWAFDLGTHTENDDDPTVFGGGDRVVDYVPTDDARIQEGLVKFLCLCIPALCGIREGFRALRRERKEASEQLRQLLKDT